MASSGSTGRMLAPLSEGAYECQDDTSDQGLSFQGGILDGHIHDAQGIHNICIYDKQDVFAKFSFTHGKAEPFCTQVISKGGRNPVFNECFQLPVTVPHSVLKCEIWMSSRAHSYLEDQLLGFALVPVSSLTSSKCSNASDEYGLSSTELFHSPAGTVRLTLVFREEEDSIRVPEAAHSQTNSPVNGSPQLIMNTASGKKHAFIKVFEDGSTNNGTSSGSASPSCYDSEEFERVEFPDLQAASEDRQLVSSYLEMSCECKEVTPGLEKSEKIKGKLSLTSTVINVPASSSLETCGSEDVSFGVCEKEVRDSAGKQENNSVMRSLSQQDSSGSPVVKQQIVDMYVKSVQQFTEALAKMQLPLDLSSTGCEATPNAKKSKNHNNKKATMKSHRVFYGSRAFF